jgi:hypothetical protein
MIKNIRMLRTHLNEIVKSWPCVCEYDEEGTLYICRAHEMHWLIKRALGETEISKWEYAKLFVGKKRKFENGTK